MNEEYESEFARMNRIQEMMAVTAQRYETARFYQTIRRIVNGEMNPEWSN